MIFEYNSDILFFLISISMNDASLCRLIQEALNDQTRAEALALALDHLPKIKVCLGKSWLPYYDKAILVTIRDVKQNINKFSQLYKLNIENLNCQNPSEATFIREYFVKWVVMILKRDCMDVWRSSKKRPREVSMSQPLGIEKGAMTIEETIAAPAISGIEDMIAEELQLIGKYFINYINTDPEGKLGGCYIQDRPDVNCQILLQKHLLGNPPCTLKQIAQELNTNLQTVNSRLKRNCKPLLQEIAKNLGYT